MHRTVICLAIVRNENYWRSGRCQMDCTYSTNKEANMLLTAGHANVQAIETGWPGFFIYIYIYTGFILGSIILGDSRISNFPNVETWNDFAGKRYFTRGRNNDVRRTHMIVVPPSKVRLGPLKGEDWSKTARVCQSWLYLAGVTKIIWTARFLSSLPYKSTNPTPTTRNPGCMGGFSFESGWSHYLQFGS